MIMRRLFLSLLLLLAATGARAQYLSPERLAASTIRGNLYVMCATAPKILIRDLADGKSKGEIKLPDNPLGMCLDDKAGIIYVTFGISKGSIQAIDLASGKTVASADAGHYPCAPTLIGEGRIAYANRFAGKVVVCDAGSLAPVASIPVTREPIDMAFSPKEQLLLVAHHLPDKSADQEVVSANVTLISTKKLAVESVIPLRNGSASLRRIALSPDGKYAAVPHVLSRFTLHTSQLEQGWQNTNVVTFIDLTKRALSNTFLLDEIYRGAGNPWGVAFSEKGDMLYVTHAGSHEVSAIDMARLSDKVANAGRVTSAFQITDPTAFENNLAFMGDARLRKPTLGKSPRDILSTAGKLWLADYFSDALEVIENPKSLAKSRLLVVGTPIKDDVRRGEFLFHDADICFEHWQSCSSCHPDARSDGFNWDLMNDKLGNPKNTLSLLYSMFSSPAMSTGVRPTAAYAVRSGMRLIQFSEPNEEDAKAIDAYLRSIKALPSPYLVDGKLSPAAEKGKQTFQKMGCTKCHNGPYLSDRKLYDVGTWTPIDMTTTAGGDTVRQTKYVTSRLVEMWRTAPYLHTGDYYTVGELLEKSNHAVINTSVKKLSEDEKQNLIEYILSL